MLTFVLLSRAGLPCLSIQTDCGCSSQVGMACNCANVHATEASGTDVKIARKGFTYLNIEESCEINMSGEFFLKWFCQKRT